MTKKSYFLIPIVVFIVSCTPTTSDQLESEPQVEAGLTDSVDPNSPFIPGFDFLDSNNNTKYVFDEFNIPILSLENRPYVNILDSLIFLEPKDENNVRMLNFRGDTVYHPVAMAQYTLNLIDLYRRTSDPEVLESIIHHADKFIEISSNIGESMIFPYMYNYAFYDMDRLVPPWYSGLAQGQILSVFARLYEITSDKKYLDVSNRVFASFDLLKADNEIWFSCIDKDGNLWFEEYPYELPSHVLNGMIFAIFGVYDYYVITESEHAKELVKASLSTVKKILPDIRVENDISYYCLKYPSQATHYHSIHIDQLNYLVKISGDEYFAEMAKLLANDHVYKKTAI